MTKPFDTTLKDLLNVYAVDWAENQPHRHRGGAITARDSACDPDFLDRRPRTVTG